jgi:hypothetical protein
MDMETPRPGLRRVNAAGKVAQAVRRGKAGRKNGVTIDKGWSATYVSAVSSAVRANPPQPESCDLPVLAALDVTIGHRRAETWGGPRLVRRRIRGQERASR